mmetsp:Transcript_43439/g.114500  ORF Transcript_43439/g.114500 Transcript_43439/m.114500 type:complete len:191 (-) Transcript_43439:123-695(-)
MFNSRFRRKSLSFFTEVCLSQRPFASSSLVPARNVRRGAILLRDDQYVEVRGIRPAGSGRNAAGGYEVRLRELATRKARETKFEESKQLMVVECDRVEMVVMFKDDAGGRLVLANANYDEVEVPLVQMGDVAEVLDSGSTVTVWMHDDTIVKVTPPREVAASLQVEQRKARREQLDARRTARSASRASPR